MIQHFELSLYACSNAGEHGRVRGWAAAVAAEQLAVGVRSDDGERFDASHVERSNAAVILKQSDRFAGCGSSASCMVFFASNDSFRFRRVDVGVVEQPHLEFLREERTRLDSSSCDSDSSPLWTSSTRCL